MKIFFILMISLYTNVVLATGVQDFAALINAQNSLSGDFQQVVKDANGDVLQESSGTFALLRPGYFRWQTLEPFPQLLVSDLQTIWLYDPDLEQATVKDYDNNIAQTPAVLFSGDAAIIAEHYSIEQLSDERYQLTPKKQQDLFEYLWVDFSGSQLKSMTLQDSLAQETVFLFNNTQANTIVNTQQFQFSPPDNTDIIRGH